MVFFFFFFFEISGSLGHQFRSKQKLLIERRKESALEVIQR